MSSVILWTIGIICVGGGAAMVALLVVVERIEQAREELHGGMTPERQPSIMERIQCLWGRVLKWATNR